MNMKLLAIAAIGTALLTAAPQAAADHKHKYRHYDGYGYYGHHVYERDRLPRWLRRHDRFRAWYRHTPLRYNLRLGWDELYSIFIWERRYSNHRRIHHYGHRADRDYRYYRKYWKKHRRDRHHRHHRRDRERRYERD